MNRRFYLIDTMTKDEYVTSGLKLHIDSILNEGIDKLVDQTGNYNSTILDGSFKNVNDYIELSNTRFLIPCGDALQNNFTISITYRRFSSGTGIIWSLTDPTQYLSGRISTGHTPNYYQYLRINGIGDIGAFANDDTNTHTVDLVINKIAGTATVYIDGILKKQFIGSYTNINSALKLIIGGYMNGDKMMEFGGLYSLKLYNRTLSLEEIQQNYNTDKERFGF